MPLPSATRLGPYEMVALLGAGAMGEVYRATDTRLVRTVAVKVLPAQFANHAERRQRFEREARAVASLNHPHICGLHDIGHDRGIDFLVLEYLEGQTLAERLVKGPLPLEQVMRCAIEIADALDHAHRHGLIHRDLKPANIFLAARGAPPPLAARSATDAPRESRRRYADEALSVKVLDFGLAKLRAVDPLPTLSTVGTDRAPLTAEDAILGTFQYMAPEQLEGREADARTDIFAFGAVVYEMATGRRAFEASSRAGTIGAILHTDPPPMASLQPTIPLALDRVVGRCLAKDPDNRWQTARDLMQELMWIADAPSQHNLPMPGLRRRKLGARLAWAAAALFAVSTLFLAVVHFRGAADERRAVRLSVLPAQSTVEFVLSPDGRQLAFVAGDAPDTSRLWIQSLDSLTPRPLAGTEGADSPFWSPDGRFIAFGSRGKLKKVAVSGGPVQTVCDAPVMVGGTWSRDGVIVFAPNSRTVLHRVSASGGTPTSITTLDRSRGENTHRWPHFLPDGRRFLYLARSTRQDNSGIHAGSLDSPVVTRVLSAESSFAYAHPGYLLFARDGALLGQPFSASGLRTLAEPIQIVEDIRYNGADSYVSFSISEHGELAYQTGAGIPRTQLAWFTRAGTRLESPGPLDNAEEPSIASDGMRVAVGRSAAGSDLWLVDVARGSSSRLTFDPGVEYAPIWSPDGNTIVFGSNRDGPSDLYQMASSGAGPLEPLLTSNAVKHPTDWSPDGRLIVYESADRKTNWDLWVLPLGSDRNAMPILKTDFAETLGRLSPNGRWIAYVSDESERGEVYVQSFPPSGGKWKISTAGGTQPRWRRDGKELFYVAADRRLMAVVVKTDSTFDHGVPAALFETRMSTDSVWSYDVTPDGQRFVISTAVGRPTPPPINILLNWTAGLPR